MPKMDWINDKGDNYLIYGDSKIGKTYVAACEIYSHLLKDPQSKCFVVNTDKGFSEPASQLGLKEFTDRIVYYFINTFQEAVEAIDEIKKLATSKDIVLFDLLSWVWDEAQKEFINELAGKNIVGFISRAMKDPKKFGAFEGMQWGYIKKLDDMVSNYLTKNPICKVIAIARSKDVTAEYKLNKRTPDIWFELGKPDGRKDIMFEFANIIKVKKDEQGKRKFIVVGTRNNDLDYKWRSYTTPQSFWDKLGEIIVSDVPKETPKKVEPKKVEPKPIVEEKEVEESTIDLVDPTEKNKLKDADLNNIKMLENDEKGYSEDSPHNKKLLELLQAKQENKDLKNEPTPLTNDVERVNFILNVAKNTDLKDKSTHIKKLSEFFVPKYMTEQDFQTSCGMIIDIGKAYEPGFGKLAFVDCEMVDPTTLNVIGSKKELPKELPKEEVVVEEPKEETADDSGTVKW